jgi:hypothetical protein
LDESEEIATLPEEEPAEPMLGPLIATLFSEEPLIFSDDVVLLVSSTI